MPVDGVSTVGYRQRASAFDSRSGGFTGNGRSKYKSPPPAYVRFGKANVRYTGAGRGPLSYYFYHYIHAIQNTTNDRCFCVESDTFMKPSVGFAALLADLTAEAFRCLDWVVMVEVDRVGVVSFGPSVSAAWAA